MIGSLARELDFFTAINAKMFPTVKPDDWVGMKEAVYRRVAHLPAAQPVPRSVMATLDALYEGLEDYAARARDMGTLLGRAVAKEEMMLNVMLGDASYVGNPQMVAGALGRAGRSAFVYLFNNVVSDPVLKLIGPAHTMDLPFIYADLPSHLGWVKNVALKRTEKATFTETEQALASQVGQYWLNFARYLDPSPAGSPLPPWPPTTGSPAWMEFTNDKPVPRDQAYYHSKQVAFWLNTYHDRVANDCVGTTETGSVLGMVHNGVKVWLGVPYAANPTGDLRWRPPQPATPWTGVMTADTRPLCPQNNLFIDSTKPVGSEDHCLELDIHVAEGVTNAKSVFVFIHGARHDFGHTWEYPASLARLSAALDPSDGVVTVNIAYRLGGLGYMAMPELTAESQHGTSGNYGMLDQIAALKWIGVYGVCIACVIVYV